MQHIGRSCFVSEIELCTLLIMLVSVAMCNTSLNIFYLRYALDHGLETIEMNDIQSCD